MMKNLLMVLLTLSLTACYSSSDAHRALEAEGFTNIEIQGHAFFACKDDDFFSTSFIATNPSGRPVKGAVCSGFLFKNATIRF